MMGQVQFVGTLKKKFFEEDRLNNNGDSNP
jgi:hypothetical protein